MLITIMVLLVMMTRCEQSQMTRLKSKGSSQNVSVRQANEAPYSKERFRSNTHNKSQLIFIGFPHKRWACCTCM